MPIGKLFNSIKEKFEGKKGGKEERDDPMDIDQPQIDPFEGETEEKLVTEAQSKKTSENPLAPTLTIEGQPKFTSFYVSTEKQKLRRFLTHLSTDKPIYREKEIVYFRGVILNGIDRLPWNRFGSNSCSEIPDQWTLSYGAKLIVYSPSGDEVFSEALSSASTDSVVSAFWTIPPNQSGGDYKAVIQWNIANFPPAEREFNIRAFRNPRVKTQIKFEKKGYGAGELATANLNVRRAEGEVPLGCKITASARVDGVQVWTESGYQLDSNGDVSVSFKLPQSIVEGDGTLSFVIEDGGVVENASQTIPILLQKMDVRIYPEGGELIQEVPNRFYVEAFTKSGDPADITAEVVERSSGKVVGSVETLHEGRGKSFFVPEAEKAYDLRVVKPSGILNLIPFPTVLSEGIALSSLKDTYNPTESVELALVSSRDYENVKVSLFKVDIELSSSTPFSLKKGEVKGIKLPTVEGTGVLRATVFVDSKPVSERIVFKHSEKKLLIQMRPESKGLAPGKSVRLHIKTTDEKGKPISANVGVTVTDDSVLEMVEKRKQVARLPEMALLENEVDSLCDSPFYFDSKEENSNIAIDLLLGTQGWRRFVLESDVKERESKVPDQGKRERLGLFHERSDVEQRGFLDDDDEGGASSESEEEEMELEEEKEETKEEATRMDLNEIDVKPVAKQRLPQRGDEPKEEKKEKAKMKDKVMRIEPKEEAKQQDKRKMVMKEMAPKKKDVAMAAPMARRRRVLEEKEREFDEDEDDLCDIMIVRQAVVREYAFKARSGRKIGERVDFKETLFWNANIKTDEKGRAVVSFDLNDSVTSFKAWADGFSTNGHLGASNVLLESREPFYLEPKIPLEVSSGDIIQLPVALANTLSEQVVGDLSVVLEGKGLKLSKDSPATSEFTLKGEERKRKVINLEVLEAREDTQLTVRASSKKSAHVKDSVTRPVRVVPSGFPYQFDSAGSLEPDQSVTHTFELPKEFIEGTVKTQIHFYPSSSSKLSEALRSLIRSPCGCFEQTSTTTYPLVMALQYFESQPKGTVDKKVIDDARKKLEEGYKKLAGYECKKGGFEWFGGDPGHEALTAYGLMQFSEMKHVISVDSGMIARTEKWLMGRRNADGSFQRNSRALDDFGGAPEEHTNAYITWALTEAGVDVGKSVDYVIEKCAVKKDAYVWALVSICLYRLKRVEQAQEWARKIAELQKEDGSVTDEATSITRSGGRSLIVETTALSLLAWISDPQDTFSHIVAKAGKYLVSCCKGGSFGSTQATLLALKAIIANDKIAASKMQPGTIIASLNGKEVGRVDVTNGSDTISLPDFGSLFKKSKVQNEIKIEMSKCFKMPYSVNLDFFATKGDTSEECKVRIDTKLNDTKLQEGSGTELEVILRNVSEESLPMTLAVIGIPGGLEVRVDKLKELVKGGVIDFYEILGRRVALYWRYMDPKAEKKILLDVVAAVPGTYSGPASNAYLYYTNEYNWWNQGLKVEISPK
eukprot:TRINITY_DN2049_c1_g4_i1.p1 TRINITY_DN2049_c1_g4~~TRINITY_DN2049_c1_g4_i1.p1  ORF type:complete len:1482 (-),score=610.29 TRINITY_DN2049_c1_g4_i1:61-4506(-)